MINKNELVIRWLDEPVDAACALCRSDKKRIFKKGAVMSLVSGELVCPKCAAMHNKNLWDVCSGYAESLREHDWETPNVDMQICDLNSNDPIGFEKYDRGILKIDEYYDHQELKYEDPFPDIVVDKCAGCAHLYQPKSDPKRK
ncbi:MAG: hypothetical protein NTU95_05610 [Methanothrix sp.]|nr:hypothetical protein [Methanothrix sp.]